jgi:Flp pilus assembly protein protease CpaA
MEKIIIDTIGWVAMILILIAYCLITYGKVTSKSISYQALNFFGAALFVVNLCHHKAWPSVVLNVIWALIALSGFWLIYQKRERGSGKVKEDD